MHHLTNEPLVPQPNEPLPKSGSGSFGRLEELETPFEFNGRQFKYRISGTPYLLEDASSYDAIMKAHNDLHSSRSVFAQEATHALADHRNIVFVYNSPTIPNTKDFGSCGFDNNLVSTEIRSSSGSFTPNSKYIEVAPGNNLLETLVHEATHSLIYSKYGGWLIGHSNSSLVVDANFTIQHRAWLSDIKHLVGSDYSLVEGPSNYWSSTFEDCMLSKGHTNKHLNNIDNMFWRSKFAQGDSINSMRLVNPSMKLSAAQEAAWKSGYFVISEVPAWSAGRDVLYPGLIREVQPKLFDLYRQLYFSKHPIEFLGTPFIDVPMNQMPTSILPAPGAKPWSWWGLTKPLGIGGLALWGGVHCYNEGRELGFSPVKSVVWSGSRVGTEFALFEGNYAIPYVGQACMFFDIATLPFVFIPAPNWDKPDPVEHKTLQAQALYENRQQSMPWWQRFFNANEIEMGPRDLANIPLVVQTAVHYRHTPIEVVSKYVGDTVVNALPETSWQPPAPIVQPQSFPWDDQRRRQLEDQ